MKIRVCSSSVMGGHYALGYMLFLVPLSLPDLPPAPYVERDGEVERAREGTEEDI
jgi:hypothetical protein